jgi:hypothetical protein
MSLITRKAMIAAARIIDVSLKGTPGTAPMIAAARIIHASLKGKPGTVRGNTTFKVQMVLQQILQNEEESHNHVDQIIHHLQLNIEREIILMCYASARESSDNPNRQAEILNFKFLEMGLYGQVTEGLHNPSQRTSRPERYGSSLTGTATTARSNDDEDSFVSAEEYPTSFQEANDLIRWVFEATAPSFDSEDDFVNGEELGSFVTGEELGSNEGNGSTEQAIADGFVTGEELGSNEGNVSTEQAIASTKGVYCPVCWETFPESETLQLLCGHSACVECCEHHIRKSSNLKCIVEQCTHEILHHEISRMLGRGDSHAGRLDPKYQEIDLSQRNQCLSKDPQESGSCPQCGLIVFRHERGGIEKATCQRCNYDFCTNCSSIYHYRTTCLIWQETRQAWNEWKVSGRSHYWRRNQERSKLAKKAAKADKDRIRRIMEEEHLDEEYKSKNCKLCPSCDKVVEKMSGCNSMRCGYDTDTGLNRQNGCGAKFHWEDEAKPYQAVKVGQNLKKVGHDADGDGSNKFHHVDVRCDGCGSTDVRGLLFECVNCPSFTLCENCEHQHTDQHQSDHVFAIHGS